MALIGSLNSGISALRNFARGLEVISNNIANVNSTAYKGSRTKYTDSFSQFLKQAATSPTDGEGSNTPAAQIGLGVQISGVQTSFLQGGLTTTGQTTDLAISGSGFFQVRNSQNNQLYATRAGDFRTDDRGYITTNDGYRLQGLTGGLVTYDAVILPDGSLSYVKNVTDPTNVGDVRIDFNANYDNGRLTNDPYLVDASGNPILDAFGNQISAVRSFGSQAFTSGEYTTSTYTTFSAVTFTSSGGNLVYPDGTPVTDGSGNPVAGAAGDYIVNANGQIVLNGSGQPYSGTAGTTYLVDSDGNLVLDGTAPIAAAAGTYLVNSSGNLDLTTGAPVAASAGDYLLESNGDLMMVNGAPVAGAAGDYLVDSGNSIMISDSGEAYAGSTGDYLINEDGDPIVSDTGAPIEAYSDAEVLELVPKMQSFSFLSNGDLNVFLTNGDSFVGGRVLLMDFNDPTALVREGANLFTGFDAAGVIGATALNAADNTPGSYGLGSIQGGTLELSNVDLTEEFANMITTQRSFQAGSRIITVSDDILQEVVNLKR